VPAEASGVVPVEAGGVAPQQATDVVPAQSSDVVPAQPADVVPAQSSDVVPAQPPDVVPAQSGGVSDIGPGQGGSRGKQGKEVDENQGRGQRPAAGSPHEACHPVSTLHAPSHDAVPESETALISWRRPRPGGARGAPAVRPRALPCRRPPPLPAPRRKRGATLVAVPRPARRRAPGGAGRTPGRCLRGRRAPRAPASGGT